MHHMPVARIVLFTHRPNPALMKPMRPGLQPDPGRVEQAQRDVDPESKQFRPITTPT